MAISLNLLDALLGDRYNEVVFPQPLKEEQDYDQVLQFFERLLRDDSPCRLDAEYPLAFNLANRDHIFVSRTKDPLAGLASLERKIEIEPGRTMNALFVGSVVTDPKARNQGLQRQLFMALEEKAETWGIDLIVLWSNQMEFYQKLGFSLAGLQASWLGGMKGALSTIPSKVKLGSTQDVPFRREYFEAFDQKRMRVHRTQEEMKKLWNIPKMFVACTDRAYALVGKGEDFEGICHEWAGPAEEVLACFDKLREKFHQLRILSPGIIHDPEESKVISRLEENQFECRLEYLGLIKILSDQLKMEDLLPETMKCPFFIWGLDSI